ncbi:MAG TPA: CopG family transcriptional regulator [Chloroflexota bacterium]|jgi:predicted transcriptional regulator
MADEQVSITFRTAASKRDTLDEIARNMKRDRSFVMNEAVEEYLWRYEDDKRAIAESRAAAARGEVYDQEEIEAEMEQWIADTLDRAS